jgi:outer membrane immunogenic protein
MKRILIAATACVVLLGGSALAADLPPAAPAQYIPPPPPPPAFTWTGCYVGAGAGYAMWNQDAYTETYPAPLTPLTSTSTFGGRGEYGYGSVGCDYQITSSIVIGASGDYSYMNAHGQFTEPLAGGTGEETQSGMWAAGVRGGLLFTPNLLTYINGGWTGTRFNQINLAPTFAGGFTGTIAATTYNGWFLGGGTETSLEDFLGFRLPRGLFLRNEYRYTYYSAKDDPIFLPGGVPSGAAVHVQKYDQMLTTAVVFKFNWR